MTRERVTAAVAAGILLLLAAPALAAPVVTKAKIRLTKKGDVRLSVRGTLAEPDWGSPQQVVVRAGSHTETLPIDSFSSSRNGRKLRYRGERTAVVKKAVFDLARGRFLLKCRSAAAGDYADPMRLCLELPRRWEFDLPVDPERRTSKFRGRIVGHLDAVTSVDPPTSWWGSSLTLDVTVQDSSSREIDLAVEYSLDDGVQWHQATQMAGEAPLIGIPATPEGVVRGFTWEVFEDLGCVHATGVRVRARPTNLAGVGLPSDPIEMTAFDGLDTNDLADEVLQDLLVHGELQSSVLVDVRSESSFDAGHIPGASWAPSWSDASAFEQALEALTQGKGTRLVFYCYSGG